MMMKRFIYIAIALGIVACNNRQGKTFEVEGTVKNTDARLVYLEELAFTGAQPVIVDSALLGKDGTFHLKTLSKDESLYSLRTDRRMFPFALVISDESKVTVNADLNNAQDPYTVKGSDASEDLREFDKMISSKAVTIFQLGAGMDSMAKVKVSDSVASAHYAKIEAAAGELKTYAIDFFNKAESPALLLYAMDSYQAMTNNIGIKGLNATDVSDIVNKASKKFPEYDPLNEVKKKLRPSQAADFTLPDVNGNQVSLSSFRGKYTLVDFWASWCQPCRKENPNVVQAYNRFKDKNFTILGVSLDQKKDAWVKAIADDGLTWTHVSDLQFWNSKVVELYKFNSIPYNLLIDPKGNIIGEDLHGEELFKTLEKVLK